MARYFDFPGEFPSNLPGNLPGAKNPYHQGNEFEYTGRVIDDKGTPLYEGRYLEGSKKGKTFVTYTSPSGKSPFEGRSQKEWLKQQEEFRRLHKNPQYLQHIEDFGHGSKAKSDAKQALTATKKQIGYVGGRLLDPKGKAEGWRAQIFFEDEPGVSWFPSGTRRVTVPTSQKRAMGINPFTQAGRAFYNGSRVVGGKFTDQQIGALRAAYEQVDRGDPKYLPQFHALLAPMTDEQLQQISKAKIKFLSKLAVNEISRREWRMQSNPLGAELLIINPAKRRSKMKLRLRRSNRRRGRKSPPRIRYHGKLYYFVELMRKFGKSKAKTIWRKSRRSKALVGSSRKALGHNGSWMRLVKKYGVMGAKRHYRKGKR
jgi:hypothetical protein